MWVSYIKKNLSLKICVKKLAFIQKLIKYQVYKSYV